MSVRSPDELAGFDGSVGLDATPVPLWSIGRRLGQAEGLVSGHPLPRVPALPERPGGAS